MKGIMIMLPFNPFSGLMAKIYGGVALLAIAVAGVQTVRIDGLWFIKGFVQRLERSEARNAKLIAASEAARAAQIAMNEAVKAEYETKARQSNEKHKANLVAIRSATNDYAASNRLSKVCPNFTGSTDTATKDSPSQGNDGLQADSIVVSKRDFDVLNTRTADAIKYEDWARSLVAAGLAEEAE